MLSVSWDSRPSFILRPTVSSKAGTPCPLKSSPSWVSKRTASTMCRASTGTSPRPRCTNRRSAAARASPPTSGRWCAAPASTPGRSPNDKFIVKEPSQRRRASGGARSTGPIEPEHFDALQPQLLAYLQGKDLFVQDCYAGADPDYRLPIRVITENAWHSLFARNMFIRERDPRELRDHEPRVHRHRLPRASTPTPSCDGTNSEVFILLNFDAEAGADRRHAATPARSRSRSSP